MPNTSEKYKNEQQQITLDSLRKKHEQSFSSFALGLASDRLDQEYSRRRRENESEAEYKERLAKEQADRDSRRDKQRLDKWRDGLGSLTSTLTSEIDKSLDKYLSAQQSMAAHLAGSDTSLTSTLNKLQSTLSTTNIVRQEDVFNNLGSLVKSGITYNVEQRAFLQTLADDIDMVFNAQNGSLTQLIRLQNRDLSSNRMAIEYSLQKFLNQNYQTSEYIKQAYQGVSEALLTAQSTMSASKAVDFEGTVQTWLGSMYSAGMNGNTINNLASALNALGSGDISNLGSGISNLVLMGAARAGLDYGALLNNGLDASTTDKLLSSIASYMQEMGANQSNVVRSQLGNLFGVSITDIMAANNMRNTSGSVSSDIGELLGEYNDFVTFGAGLKNTMANLMWSFGTNIASNQNQLLAYEITKLISDSGIGDVLYSAGSTLTDLGSIGKGSIMKILGIAATNAPLLPILSSFFGSNGLISDISSSLKYRNNVEKLFSDMSSSGSSVRGSDVRISDAGLSGGIYVSSSGLTDLLASSRSSLNDLTGSVVTVESEDQGPTLEENVTTITETVTALLDLLTERLESIDTNVTTLAATNNVFSAAVTGWTSVTGFSI